MYLSRLMPQMLLGKENCFLKLQSGAYCIPTKQLVPGTTRTLYIVKILPLAVGFLLLFVWVILKSFESSVDRKSVV